MYVKNHFLLALSLFSCVFFLLNNDVIAQNSRKDKRIIADCQEAKEEFINVDGLMKNLFENAYGYVIFPNVGKGGFFIGGATGNGMVFQKGKIIGSAKLSQLSVGFQAGGQAYREVIFFEGEQELERFKRNNIELSAQASAVAVTAGASGNAKYENGVMIFTQTKGGLMYEASIGGQKFKFQEF